MSPTSGLSTQKARASWTFPPLLLAPSRWHRSLQSRGTNSCCLPLGFIKVAPNILGGLPRVPHCWSTSQSTSLPTQHKYLNAFHKESHKYHSCEDVRNTYTRQDSVESENFANIAHALCCEGCVFWLEGLTIRWYGRGSCHGQGRDGVALQGCSLNTFPIKMQSYHSTKLIIF